MLVVALVCEETRKDSNPLSAIHAHPGRTWIYLGRRTNLHLAAALRASWQAQQLCTSSVLEHFTGHLQRLSNTAHHVCSQSTRSALLRLRAQGHPIPPTLTREAIPWTWGIGECGHAPWLLALPPWWADSTTLEKLQLPRG